MCSLPPPEPVSRVPDIIPWASALRKGFCKSTGRAADKHANKLQLVGRSAFRYLNKPIFNQAPACGDIWMWSYSYTTVLTKYVYLKASLTDFSRTWFSVPCSSLGILQESEVWFNVEGYRKERREGNRNAFCSIHVLARWALVKPSEGWQQS